MKSPNTFKQNEIFLSDESGFDDQFLIESQHLQLTVQVLVPKVVGNFDNVGLLFIVGAIGFGVLFYFINERVKEANEQIAQTNEQTQNQIDKAKKNLAASEDQWPAVVRQFKERKKALRGIYREVTGNATAF